MPSLLDDPYADPGQSRPTGLLGLDMPRIAQPDPDTDQGAALGDLYQRIAAEQARQQQISADRGLWTGGGLLEGGHPTGKGAVDAARQTAQGVMMGTTAPGDVSPPASGILAYHGSPYDFERFDTSKIGTGEGAQAYGHGLYMAENEGVARQYRDQLSDVNVKWPTQAAQSTFEAMPQAHQDIIANMVRNGAPPAQIRSTLQSMADGAQSQADYIASGGRASANYGPDGGASLAASAKQLAGLKTMPRPDQQGRMYEVGINADPEQFLHWDKPLSEQSPQVQDALGKLGIQPHDFSVRQTDNGYVVDYQGKTSSRTFPTQEAAQSAADATATMQGKNPTGAEIVGKNPGIELKMAEAGMPGIRYLDQGSRGAGPGTHNYVVFDAATIDILRKYGLAGLGIGLSGAAATRQQPEQ